MFKLKVISLFKFFNMTKESIQAMNARKQRNALMEMDAKFLKTKADIAKYQFEEMDFTIKSFEIRDKYVEILEVLSAEAQEAQEKLQKQEEPQEGLVD